ncbi:DUF2332 domain-containing protein [Okibacterium fritillariae]|uniref:DUF2332 domain-containing protein n=1 Tax=Okibacterium fritillariae TaxID=123320 RepID=A0A1T5IWD3_9MICO|nr:DUF2332 domain-containing protein [Okibacterium fritillariae]SKC43253.1 hypothetical protein SAMN06309945_0907 [Okibacterium fritillariae]
MDRTRAWYERFARQEAAGRSPLYVAWAEGVAADDEVLALLDELPPEKRQPNLLFACARWCGADDGMAEVASPREVPSPRERVSSRERASSGATIGATAGASWGGEVGADVGTRVAAGADADNGGTPYAAFRGFVVSNWSRVAEEMRLRSTQTNEPGRTASILPVLAQIDEAEGPLALIDVGASAGLCLYPDRYSFRLTHSSSVRSLDAEPGAQMLDPDDDIGRVDAETGAQMLNPDDGIWRLDPEDGLSSVVLETVITDTAGRNDAALDSADRDKHTRDASETTVPAGPDAAQGSAEAIPASLVLPTRMPRIAWRAGIDLAPIDVRDAEDIRWFLTLLWPEETERRSRIEAALEIVRRNPPLLVTGDAVDDLAALVAQVPAGATPVVVTAGVLAYLPPARREEFAREVRRLGVRWISNEGERVLPAVAERLARIEEAGAAASEPGRFIIALDGEPLAVAGPHGQWLRFL